MGLRRALEIKTTSMGYVPVAACLLCCTQVALRALSGQRHGALSDHARAWLAFHDEPDTSSSGDTYHAIRPASDARFRPLPEK